MRVAFVWLGLILASMPVHAAENGGEATASELSNRYLTLGAGARALTAGGNQTEFALAARYGAGFYHDDSGALLSLGISVTYAGHTGDTPLGWGTHSVLALMSDLILRGAFGTRLYLGGRFGLGFTSISSGVPGFLEISGSATNFAFSPVIGYEFMLSRGTSLNLDLSWLSVGGGTMVPTSGSGSSRDYDATAGFMLTGGIGFHW
jgi:hypothetical protein